MRGPGLVVLFVGPGGGARDGRFADGAGLSRLWIGVMAGRVSCLSVLGLGLWGIWLTWGLVIGDDESEILKMVRNEAAAV